MTGYRFNIQTYKKHPLAMVFLILVWTAAIVTALVFIAVVGYVLITGIPQLKPSLFAWNYTTENVSMLPAIITTIEMVGISLLIAAPLGIFCSIYLVEYAKRGNKIVKLVRLTAETLQGIPSIVYGLFGMLFFVTALKWSYSLLAGCFTISIMILPLIMRSTEEALKSVDDSFREGSYALGAGKLRTIFKIILPSSINGVLAGVILAIGRIIGETAALIYTAGTVAKLPATVMESGRTLSIHMYQLSREGLHTGDAAATAVVLLLTVFALNGLASFAAKKFDRTK